LKKQKKILLLMEKGNAMRYAKIGATDINSSVVALGTWAMGGDSNWGPCDDDESIRTIHKALDMGVNLFDTAPVYGFGHSEEILSKALEGRRDKVYISTKCGLRWDINEGYIHKKRDGLTLRRNLTPESIKIEAERSLKRLRTDYIDIYITHWQTVPGWGPPNPVTMEALCNLKKEGKIRAIGLANAALTDIEEYGAWGPVDLVQNKYSMLNRETQGNILKFCGEKDITFQPYSPLEQGLLAGKIGPDTAVFNKARAGNKWYERENRTKVLAMLEKFKPLCEKYNCGLAALVVAWTLAQGTNVHVLCGSRKIGQIRENALGGGITLEPPDLAAINACLQDLSGPSLNSA
jgi:methylglyoxal reductase